MLNFQRYYIICLNWLSLHYLINQKMKTDNGPDRDLNPGPLAPEARIIPLDHRADV